MHVNIYKLQKLHILYPPPPTQQKSLKNFVTLWSKHIVLQNGSFTDFEVLFPAVVMDFLFH